WRSFRSDAGRQQDARRRRRCPKRRGLACDRRTGRQPNGGTNERHSTGSRSDCAGWMPDRVERVRLVAAGPATADWGTGDEGESRGGGKERLAQEGDGSVPNG